MASSGGAPEPARVVLAISNPAVGTLEAFE